MSQFTIKDFIPNIKEVFEDGTPLATGRIISIVDDTSTVSYSNCDRSMGSEYRGLFRNKVPISSIENLPLIYLYAGVSKRSYGVNVAFQVSNKEERVKRKIRTRIPTGDMPKPLNYLGEAVDIGYILDRIDQFTIYAVGDNYRRAIYVDIYNENDREKYKEFVNEFIGNYTSYREITDIVLEVVRVYGEEYVNVTLFTDYYAYIIDSLVNTDRTEIRSEYKDIVKYFDTDTDSVLNRDLIHYRDMFG